MSWTEWKCRPCGRRQSCIYGCGCREEVEKLLKEGEAWWLNEEQVMPKWRHSQDGADTLLQESDPNATSAPAP